jgi:hypothetical protein
LGAGHGVGRRDNRTAQMTYAEACSAATTASMLHDATDLATWTALDDTECRSVGAAIDATARFFNAGAGAANSLFAQFATIAKTLGHVPTGLSCWSNSVRRNAACISPTRPPAMDSRWSWHLGHRGSGARTYLSSVSCAGRSCIQVMTWRRFPLLRDCIPVSALQRC